MTALGKKLKSKKGETLIEALAAILIIALASSVLVYSVATAARINKAAEQDYNDYRNAVNEAEGGSYLVEGGSVTIKEQNGTVIKQVEADFYSGESGDGEYALSRYIVEDYDESGGGQ